MKTRLLLAFCILLTLNLFAQIPTTDLVREYLFTNGSLSNNVSPGATDLVATGTSRASIIDPIGTTNNAIDVNTDTFETSQRGSRFDVSVSFWIKTTTNDATVRSVIEQSGGGGFGPYGWKVQLVDGKIRLRSKFTNGGTDFKEVIIETSVIADNTWHHITFTAKNQQQPGFVAYGYVNRLYVDGIQEAVGVDYTNGSNSFLNSTTTNASLTHKITLSNTVDAFTSDLDNIRIYNRTISVAEVNELYKDYFSSLTRFYVNQSATGTGFGDSWTNAFTNLQKALNVASGQEIWVAQGTYLPDVSDRAVSFTITEDVNLYGGFIGNETLLDSRDVLNNPTILSGDLLGNDNANLDYTEPTRLDNSIHVMRISGDNTLINGFTVQNGHADNGTTSGGGGILKDSAVKNLEVRNCTIKNNIANIGGAIHAIFPSVDNNSVAVIDNCKIQNNVSRYNTAFHISMTFTNVPSILNANISNCLIENNFASDINSNTGITGSAGGFIGFSIANKSMNAYLTNCTITNNVDNGTNSSIVDPGLIYSAGNVNFRMYNSIAWNNSISRTFTRTPNSTAYVSCQNTIAFVNNITEDDLSTICAGATVANNSNLDPLFTNSTNDFSLQSGSPAIDSGDNSYVTTTEDILLNDRIYNGTVDLGAYESSFGPNNNSLTLNIEGSGTLSIPSGSYTPNSTVTVTATPNFGSTFVGWTGDVISTDNTISILMDGNKTLTAKFESPIFVDASATGNNDGSNWTDAYVNLNDAIASTVSGDQIWVASGVYVPSTSARNSYYVIDKEDLKVYGGFDGTEVQLSNRIVGANETILSGDVQGNDANVSDFFPNYSNTTRNADNTYRIINITAAGNNLLLDGLTISDAHNNASTTSRGAAIFKEKTISDLTLRNCIIKDNVARNDNAGLVAEFQLNNTSGDRGKLVIENCQFINNMSRWATSIYVFVRPSTNLDVTVANTLFDGNLTGDLTPTVRGISGSASWYRVIGDNSDLNLNLSNNTYVNNIDLGTDQGMTNTNRAVVGISKTAGTNRTINATVANSIFWSNTTETGATTKSITDFYKDPVTVNVFNSIDEANFNDSSLTTTINTSNANPLFENISANDYSLTSTSPAVDTGDNAYTFGMKDLKGDARIFNTTVDMGAYEYTSAVILAPQVFLQGALLSSTNNTMTDDLRVGNFLPTTSPYLDGATCNSSVFAITGNNAIVDWILVELRDAANNTTVVASQSALLQRDGDVVGLDGISSLVFNQASGDYYIAIKHRNHLGIMTNNAISLNGGAIVVDFTDANNQITFGANAQTDFGMANGTVAMWAGNVNGDTTIQYSGTTPDTPNILSRVLNDSGNFLNFPTYVVNGYNADDINMDGNTQYSGTNPDTPFILQNVLAHPGNFLNFSTYQIQEQLPEN